MVKLATNNFVNKYMYIDITMGTIDIDVAILSIKEATVIIISTMLTVRSRSQLNCMYKQVNLTNLYPPPKWLWSV